MNVSEYQNLTPGVLRQAFQSPSSTKGSVLVYLIVVILIFGVLGVTMVSLFTSATTSSATPNDARRAYFIAESGIRYGLSRIRNVNFHEDFIEDINQTTAYTLEDGSWFSINIFNPGFKYTSSAGADLTLEVSYDGKIPKNFSIPNVTLVNWQDFREQIPPAGSHKLITGSALTEGNNSFTITLEDTGFIANVGDTVCLAVHPEPNPHTIMEKPSINSYIYVDEDAKDFLPNRNGAIKIYQPNPGTGIYYDWAYEKLDHDSANNRVILSGLTELPGAPPWTSINVAITDYVILSPSNYRVITTGKSGDVTVVLGLDKQQIWAFPPVGDWTITEREFIEDVSQKVSDIVNPVAKTELGITKEEDKIILGGDDPGFGDLWYGGDKPIGGSNNHCQGGKCLFQDGIRVFFTLDNSSGDGEGFVFALINGAGNTSGSAGGDVERSELLGYAGDSRENPSGAPFLDGSLNGDGLLPPKMGVEFDTRTNFDPNFEQTLQYCTDATTLREHTRNDPMPDDNPEDAVQYVFWGSETMGVGLNPSINCREDDSTYDDNKHDADDIFEAWAFDTGGDVWSSPAVDTNVTVGIYGRVYVGSESKFFYGLNPADRLADGTENTLTANEWEVNTNGTLESNAAIGDDGMVYFGAHGGSGEGLVYAINPASRLAGLSFPYASGNEWLFSNAAIGGHSNIWTSPAIDYNGTRGDTSDDRIYIADDDGVFYAFPPHSATPKWWFKPIDFSFDFIQGSSGKPALANYNGRKRVYITGREGNDKTLFALDPEDRQQEYSTPGSNPFPNENDTIKHEWTFDIGNPAYSMPGVDLGNNRIYSGENGGRMVGLTAEGVEADSWSSPVYNTAGGPIYSTPVVDDDGIIYVLPSDGKLHAVNADGTKKWTFQSGGADSSIPAIGPDGTIYFGSLDERLYAVGYDGVSATGTEKFNFPTDGKIQSSPAIDPRDETVYVGSDSNYLYAINQLAEPRSYRTEQYEEKKVVSADDFASISFTDSDNWLQEGPWAVRMEITRDTVASEGVYVLKAWLEKCSDSNCSKPLSSLFRDTLIEYDVAAIPPKLEQTIKLSGSDHDKFQRFLFGFTTAAASGDTQESIIKFFELSFIRPSDPVVTSDPNMGG